MTDTPRQTLATNRTHTVRCFGRLKCDDCGRPLGACDLVDIQKDGTAQIVCAGCHADLLKIDLS